MEDGVNLPFYVLVGAGLRFFLAHSGLFGLSERPELATPLNSYKRLREGIVLSQNNQDPYEGLSLFEIRISYITTDRIFLAAGRSPRQL